MKVELNSERWTIFNNWYSKLNHFLERYK
jgi:hypothetical protein